MSLSTRNGVVPALAVLLFCFSAALTEELPPPSGAFHAISVRDIAVSVEWYTEHLGFELDSEGANEERKGVLLRRPGTVLELAEFEDAIDRESIRPGLESWNVYGIFKLGFLTAELDATLEYLEDEDVDVFFPIVTTPDGVRTFAVKDPDGNIIQFFEG